MATKVKTGVLGTLTELNFADSGKAQFGTGPDLQIYHDGSNARIRELTGELRLQTTSGGVNALVAKSNAAVEIFHAGSKKLETTSTGVDVTGGIDIKSGSTTHGTITTSSNSLTLNARNTGILLFQSGGNEKMRIDSSGNVGIGSSTINAKFNVHGTIRAENDKFLAGRKDAATPAYSFHDDGDTGIFNVNSNILGFSTAGSEAMRIDSSGNVGIGTTAPSGILSIPATDTTTKPQIRFMTTGATNLADAALSTTDDSGGTNLLIGSNQYYSGGSIARFDTSRSGTAIDFGYTGTIKFFTGSGNAAPTEAMRIESDGDVTIKGTFGTNSSTAFASMGGRLQFDTDYSDTQRGPNKIVLQEDGSWIAGLGVSNGATDFYSGGHMTFRTGTSLGTERMRILSGGDVCIGKDTNDINTQGFHFIASGTYTGTVYSGITGATAGSTYHVRDTTNNTWKFYVTNAGVINATSTSITSLSDERLKENIVDLETGLEEVMSLKPRRFDWKEGEGNRQKNVAGFIAQEVETVLPDLIDDFMHDDLDDAKSVKMGDMIPTLVKAIQELKAEIEELKESK